MIRDLFARERLVFALGLFCAVAGASSAIAQDFQWAPRHTFVFIVGTLEWEDSESFESFPRTHRRDAQLARFFRDKGVPAQQLIFLSDRKATTGRVTTSLNELLARTGENDTLFLYFTGHGYHSEDERTTYFATYDASEDSPGWSTDALIRSVARNFRGSRVFMAADCCYSGALVDGVRRLHGRQSFACLASSTSRESSTANWTFTEMLLSALRGESFADLNGDGTITLGELARSIKEDMRFAEDQRSTSVFTGELDQDSEFAAADARPGHDVGRRVEVLSEGDWYKARIIDEKEGQYLVHYFGYEADQDEWVDPDDVRTEARSVSR